MLGDGGFSISFSTYGDRALADRVRAELGPSHPHLREDAERQHGLGYYAPLAIKIDRMGRTVVWRSVTVAFVSWIAQLAADAKERCLVSCISPERLLAT